MIRWVDKNEMNATRHIIDAGDIQVHPPGMWENETALDILDWWAVSDDDGIFVYTDEEATADELRLHFEKTAVKETIEQHVARG